MYIDTIAYICILRLQPVGAIRGYWLLLVCGPEWLLLFLCVQEWGNVFLFVFSRDPFFPLASTSCVLHTVSRARDQYLRSLVRLLGNKQLPLYVLDSTLPIFASSKLTASSFLSHSPFPCTVPYIF